jgi:thiamine biosynthesis protein ThiI
LTILIAYGEIALKGQYVRRNLEIRLVEQIEYVLKEKGVQNFKVSRRYGRIYVDGASHEAAVALANIFGVVSVMPAEKTSYHLDDVITLIIKQAKNKLANEDTFAIRPKVVGDVNYTSRDLAVKGGSNVLDKLNQRNISVNLNEPDVTIYVEVRDKDAFVFTNIIDGVGGLPYGSQGKMVSLFSGGIDSPIATWLMMKRGAEILALFMDQSPYVGEDYTHRVENAFELLRKFAPSKNFSLYSAPIGGVMARILEASNPSLRCVICKRAMYRIAELFANNREAKGIVTGESLGQVASQTLDNLYVLDEAVQIPVIRPIIGFDKVEIEHIAQKIGTYNITAKSVNGCTVVPDRPSTRSSISDVNLIEKEMGIVSLCEEAASNIKKI